MCLKTVKDDIIRCIQQQLTEFHPRDDHHELLHLSLLFCELTAVMIHTFRLLWHSTELNACQRSWLVLCSLTLSLSSPQPWSKCFTTTQQIILDELSSTRRQLRSSCVTLCHNTPYSFSQPSIYHSNEQSRYMEYWQCLHCWPVESEKSESCQRCSRVRGGLDSGVQWSSNQKKQFLLQVIENTL